MRHLIDSNQMFVPSGLTECYLDLCGILTWTDVQLPVWLGDLVHNDYIYEINFTIFDLTLW